MAKDKEPLQPADNTENKISFADIKDSLTIDGKPVFKSVRIDPKTGDLLEWQLAPEFEAKTVTRSKYIKTAMELLLVTEGNKAAEYMQAAAAENEEIKGAIKEILNYLKENHQEIKDTADNVQADLAAAQSLWNEIQELKPYITEELRDPKYRQLSFSDLIGRGTLGELLEMSRDSDSELAQILDAARASKAAENTVLTRVFKMQEEKSRRQTKRENARKSGAVMSVKNEALLFFSDPLFQDAFNPQKIDIMAGLESENDIEAETGKIKDRAIERKEQLRASAVEIPLSFLSLLAAIGASTVDDKRKEKIPSNKVTFYVDGVLNQIAPDKRAIYGRQIDIFGKDPGEQYIEAQIAALQKYIGKIGGSRYSIISFESYDSDSDTMTVRMPYLYELLRRTQDKYFKNKKEIENTPKKNINKALAPPMTNELFKMSAFTVNQTTLQIAVTITNSMLQAGKSKGKDKKYSIKFKTLISECPALKETLEELENLPQEEKIKSGTTSQKYNAELKKIGSAIDLILNPEKCRATEYFKIKSISPAKRLNNPSAEESIANYKFIPPTKTKLEEMLIIEYERL